MVDLRGRRVLVTGASGFIGTRLVERLVLEERAEVRVLMRNWTHAAWVARVQAEFVAGDVADVAAVAAAVAGCDTVFHCASSGNSRAEYMRTNVEGTRNVLDAALAAGARRLVYISSVVVHGAAPPAGFDENAPFIKTGRGYNDSKIAAEELIGQYSRDRGIPAVIIRPTFVWGPRSGQFTVGPLLAMKAGTFRLVDNGAGSCHAVYVDNLVDALLLAAVRDEAAGQAFLVSDGVDRTWREFFGGYAGMVGVTALPSVSARSPVIRSAAALSDALERVLVVFSPNPAPLWRKVLRRSARIVRSWLQKKGVPSRWYLELYSRQGGLCIDKARRLLGYQPRVDLKAGMALTERWARDQLGTELGFDASKR